ncbi:DNA polymerase Y family protein [Streptomyces sp. bgisy100]|uniref:DNA polymerase Y family protein n=1 Tax=Streptomyces sp. bgisy100 TaxID=3413783 RepID=UPI003D73F74E
MRFRTAGTETAPGEETYPELLGLLAEFSPVIEALPPDAALVDVRGALRYFGRDAVGIAGLVRVRALARHGVDCTVGVAGNPLLARLAALDPAPGDAIRTVPDDPGAMAAFLAPRPVTALHGVGPATARTLGAYGLDSVGRIAATPPATLQRILGASAGRRVYDRAHGIDPTPVSSAPGHGPAGATTRSVSAEQRFDHDELGADLRRRALLALAADLGFRMRADGRVARALTLTVRYADRTTTTRTQALPEPTAHTPALAATAYALHDALGLQRARVRAVSLRAEDLTGPERSGRQLTFDRQAANAWLLEPVLDRANMRWPGAVRPAVLADPPRRTA